METVIREATSDDIVPVAAFFTAIYEGQHGIGSTGSIEMLRHTIALLFPDDGQAPTVFVSESGGMIHGVVAVNPANASGECEIVTIQVNDTVRGRGVAQTLLRRIVEHCAAVGGETLTTEVPLSDVRSRGFLRREGFAAAPADFEATSGAVDGTLWYSLTFAGILERGDGIDHGLVDRP